MKMLDFLQKNFLWNFAKNTYSDLFVSPTTEEQLFGQLQRLSDRYFPQRNKVETTYTEFCLNDVALSFAKTPSQKCAKQLFNENWSKFLRVKNVFDKEYMSFPSEGGKTRLDYIAELIVRCTQCAAEEKSMQIIFAKVRELFDLEERENRNLENAVTLYEINLYCAICQRLKDNDKEAEIRLAKICNFDILKTSFTQNTNLRHSYYSSGKLVANVDCLANSATKFTAPTATDVKPYFFVNGRNVFDTFCYSKFGKRTAEFYSENASVKVSMRYFLDGAREIRHFKVENKGKSDKKLVADFLFRHLNSGDKTCYFDANGALCLAVEGSAEFYTALTLVRDNKICECPFEQGRLSHTFKLKQNGSLQFDLVTIFAENMPALSDELQRLEVFGGTRCPYFEDKASDSLVNLKNPLNTTSHGYAKRSLPQKEATTLNFTFQLGNDNVSTFLDNAGNSTTLLNGFAFGVSGEKIYSVKNGMVSLINCGKFTLREDTVIYKKENGTVCTMSHTDEKTYKIDYPTPQKTLFYFPLEEKSKISFENNIFTVEGQLRRFTVKCQNTVESFTTNALECNTERLRYKLSGNLECGSCLAICFASAASAELEIASLDKIASPTPLVRESLVSTYLNYVNCKNVFCLNNYLKRADCLTLAAINFTNPQFVKDYINNSFSKNIFFYDVTGRRKNHYDRLTLPLAVIYYANLTNDKDFPTDEMKKYVSGVLFNEAFTGRELCVKALALKKAAHIKGFDKVRCLIEYNSVKKIITSDAKLYGYAQAIGAVALSHPSKERLKDLCNKLEIPKSWYYVSQLENLYGLTLIEGTLQFAPKVTQENVLEQLAIDVDGKRINTTFAKATVQSMTLNGTQYFIPFRLRNLKNKNNTLVVRY